MRRVLCAWAPVLSGLLLLTGCIKSRMLVVVKPDASGYVVLTQVTPSRAYGGRSQGAEAFAATLDKAAERFGEGVKLAKSERIGTQGFAAVFAFTNVNTLTVPLVAAGPLADMTGGDMDGAPSFMRQSVQFALSHTNGTRLDIQMPNALLEALSQPVETNTTAEAEGASPDMEDIAGLQIEIAVEVRGRVLTTTASHADTNRPNRFVLFQLHGDALSRNPQAMRALSAGPSDMNDADGFMARFLRLAGATVETNRQVAIRFQQEAP